MKKWYDAYTGLPFRHLGNDPKTGIDCFNLCALILKQRLSANVKVLTSTFCNIVDADWYNKTNESFLDEFNNPENGFIKVTDLKIYDIVVMSIGSTNVPNHCAMYVDDNKVLHIMDKHLSWISPYGNYYKQYTTGIYRWKNLNN